MNLDQSQTNIKECVDVCLETQRTCTQTIPHCLSEGGDQADVKHIRLLLECAEICALNANYMMRGSERHYATCFLCAEICEECAKECEKFPNDIFMKRCAEICRTCAAACRKMASLEPAKKEDRDEEETTTQAYP